MESFPTLRPTAGKARRGVCLQMGSHSPFVDVSAFTSEPLALYWPIPVVTVHVTTSLLTIGKRFVTSRPKTVERARLFSFFKCSGQLWMTLPVVN